MTSTSSPDEQLVDGYPESRHRPSRSDLSSPAGSQLDGGEFFSEAEYISRRDALPPPPAYSHYPRRQPSHPDKLTNGTTSSDDDGDPRSGFSSVVEVDMDMHMNGGVASRRRGSRAAEEAVERRRREALLRDEKYRRKRYVTPAKIAFSLQEFK